MKENKITQNSKEKLILKIIEWCHKNDKNVTDIDFKTLLQSVTAPIRSVNMFY